MAKSPTKAPTIPASKAKTVKTNAPTVKPPKAPRAGSAVKPAIVKPAATSPVPKAAAQPPKVIKVKPPKAEKLAQVVTAKSVLKQTTAKISELASDILADRIVPSYEQIKALAASALGQDKKKGLKSRGKKKKK